MRSTGRSTTQTGTLWGIADLQQAMMQQINFLKNVSLLGGALLVAYFGAGPCSLDARVPQNRV